MATMEELQTEIASMLDIPDDELTLEQKQAMDVYLDELAAMEAAKVDSFAQFIRMQTAMADACREESKRLADKAKAAENKIGWLKYQYTNILQKHGLKKIQGDIYTLSVRASEAVTVPQNTMELEKLAEKEPLYFPTVTTVKPDKKAIKEALKDGLAIPGCSLATNYSLQIR